MVTRYGARVLAFGVVVRARGELCTCILARQGYFRCRSRTHHY